MDQTLDALLREGTLLLSGVSESPRLDAEVLLYWALNISRLDYLKDPTCEVSRERTEKYLDALARRRQHEPVAIITGEKEFWSLLFKVTKEVLVPRPETELLVSMALAECKLKEGPLKICDLGTGSGCIAVALGTELRNLKREFDILAIDLNARAIKVAAENVRRHSLGDRITVVNASWTEALKNEAQFSLIVSNPPYISRAAKGLPKDLAFEPSSALFAAEDGLEAIHFLLKQVPEFLGPGGVFFCEIGQGQSKTIAIPSSWSSSRFHKDLSGIERVLEVRV